VVLINAYELSSFPITAEVSALWRTGRSGAGRSQPACACPQRFPRGRVFDHRVAFVEEDYGRLAFVVGSFDAANKGRAYGHLSGDDIQRVLP